MSTSIISEGGTKRRSSKARILLIVAMVLEWLGLLWIVYCAGDALLAVVVNARFSDVVADVVPVALAGGLGFTVTWSIASLARRHSVFRRPLIRRVRNRCRPLWFVKRTPHRRRLLAPFLRYGCASPIPKS